MSYIEALNKFETTIKEYIDNPQAERDTKQAIRNSDLDKLLELTKIEYTHIVYSIYTKQLDTLKFLLEKIAIKKADIDLDNNELTFISFQCIYYDYLDGFKHIVNNYIREISRYCLYKSIEYIRYTLIEYILFHYKKPRDFCHISAFDKALKTGNDHLVRKLVNYGLYFPDYRLISNLDISGIEYAISNYGYKFHKKMIEHIVLFRSEKHNVLDIIGFFDYLKEKDTEKIVDWVSYSKDLFRLAIKSNDIDILRKFKNSYGAKIVDYILVDNLDIDHLELIRSVYTDFSYPSGILDPIIRYQSKHSQEKLYRFLDHIKKTDIDKKVIWSSTWITLAIQYNNLDMIKYLYKMGFRFNSYSDSEEIYRCSNVEIIKFLLENCEPTSNPLLTLRKNWVFRSISANKLAKIVDFTSPGLIPLLYMDLTDMDKTLRQKAREQRGLIEYSKKT